MESSIYEPKRRDKVFVPVVAFLADLLLSKSYRTSLSRLIADGVEHRKVVLNPEFFKPVSS